MSADFLQRELVDVETDLMAVGEIIQFLGANPKQGSEEVVATWVEWLGRAVSRIGQDVQDLRAIAERAGGGGA